MCFCSLTLVTVASFELSSSLDSLLSINNNHKCDFLMPSKSQLLVHPSRVIFWLFQGHENFYIHGSFRSLYHYICVSFQSLCIAMFRHLFWDLVKWGVGSSSSASKKLTCSCCFFFSLSFFLIKRWDGSDTQSSLRDILLYGILLLSLVLSTSFYKKKEKAFKLTAISI